MTLTTHGIWRIRPLALRCILDRILHLGLLSKARLPPARASAHTSQGPERIVFSCELGKRCRKGDSDAYGQRDRLQTD